MESFKDRNVISGIGDLESLRREDFNQNIRTNKVIKENLSCNCDRDECLNCARIAQEKDRYLGYRENWRQSPQKAFDLGLQYRNYTSIQPHPLCVDIEVAAVCDLACPFCFRQSIVTADKIMKLSDFETIINQVKDLQVPSVKLNWRGEPLLHPQIVEMIEMCKASGVLEVIINTNATRLDEEIARGLIKSGLDRIIYSFDGGTKTTYEKMRPGRFHLNTFEDVYSNIVRFNEIRNSEKAFWPRTQIQMIVTEETKNEQEKFISNFRDHVDYVSVKPYTERGGALTEVAPELYSEIENTRNELGLDGGAEIRWDIEGNLYVSTGRLPCEQPFQRLMITYDGIVSMCCYDWGSSYPVGYVLSRAFEGKRDISSVVDSINNGKRGFTLMSNAKVLQPMIEIDKKVQSLKEIWEGENVEKVRRAHVNRNLSEISICKNCKFKETYSWQRIEIKEK